MGCQPSKERSTSRPAANAVASLNNTAIETESTQRSAVNEVKRQWSSSISFKGSSHKKDDILWKANVESRELSDVSRKGSMHKRTRDTNKSTHPDAYSKVGDNSPTPESFPDAKFPNGHISDELSTPGMYDTLPALDGEMFPSLGLCYGIATHLGRRSVNEDRHACEYRCLRDKDIGCFGVFDGHGGAEVAEFMSQHMHNHIFDQFTNCGNLHDSVASACRNIDEEIHQKNLVGGSTAVLSIFEHNRGIFASVGDSQVVMSVRGEARDLCAIHKPDDPIETQRIEDCNGKVIDGRVLGVLGVSRAFGDNDLKTSKGEFAHNFKGDLVISEPDIVTIDLTTNEEFCVLACDGVFDVMTPQEVVNFVRKHLLQDPNVHSAAKALINHAIQKGSTDNVSAIIIAFHQSS